MVNSLLSPMNRWKHLSVFGVVFLFLLSGCTRYSYIPRQHHFFVSENKESQREYRKKAEPSFKQKAEEANPVLVMENGAVDQTAKLSKDKPYNPNVNNTPTDLKNEGSIGKSIHQGIKRNLSKVNPLPIHLVSKFRENGAFKKFSKKAEPTYNDGNDVLAVISLLLAIVSLIALVIAFLGITEFTFYFFMVAFFLAIAALITGIISLSQSKKWNDGPTPNAYMSWISIIVSGVELVIYLVMLIFLAMLLAIFGGL